MKKKLIVLILVLTLLSSVCLFTACGDNGANDKSENSSNNSGGESGNTSAITEIVAYTLNVDYSTIDFEQITSDDVEESELNWFLAGSSETFPVGIRIDANGKYGCYKKESTATGLKDFAMFLARSSNSLIAKCQLGNNSLRAETYGDELRFTSLLNKRRDTLRLSMSQLRNDYFLQAYGLTPENIAQMKADYEKEQQQTGDSSDDNTSGAIDATELLHSLILSAIDYEAIQIFRAYGNDGTTFIKISLNAENLIEFLNKVLPSNIGDQIAPICEGINTLDIYAANRYEIIVDARIDIDATLPAISIGLVSRLLQLYVHPRWLKDVAPLDDVMLPEYLASYLLLAFADIDIEDIDNKTFLINGSLQYRLTRGQAKGILTQKQCKVANWDTLIKTYAGALA